MAETFATTIEKERQRLTKKLDELADKKAQIGKDEEEIRRELSAIQAYEDAKKGTVVRTPRKRHSTKKGTVKRRTQRRRSKARKQQVQEVIERANGISRGEIIDALGVRGEPSGGKSVSNALSSLKKEGVIDHRDRKYFKK